MTGWAKKRFWNVVSVEETATGWSVALDGRPVKTPAKSLLVLPTVALAEAVAAEWDAVEDLIKPDAMPFTRSANSAIDKVTVQFAEVADLIAAYGGSDLLCYRADSPAELAARQAAAWDPLLDWAAETMDARLRVGSGIMPVAQDDEALARLSARVHGLTPFGLTGLHDLVGITGSLVLGLAVIDGRLAADEAWALSRIDEDWQIEQWGEDEEAAEHAAFKRGELLHAASFHALSLVS